MWFAAVDAVWWVCAVVRQVIVLTALGARGLAPAALGTMAEPLAMETSPGVRHIWPYSTVQVPSLD